MDKHQHSNAQKLQRSSGSLPRNAGSWREMQSNDAAVTYSGQSGQQRLDISKIQSRSQNREQFQQQNPQRNQYFRYSGRQQTQPDQKSSTERPHRKARSNSFHDQTGEDRSLEDLTSDPEIALKLLKHQNRRQTYRLEEIIREDDNSTCPPPEAKNFSSHDGHALHRGGTSRRLEWRHLGCKLDVLKNKISSQQLVIDSLRQKEDPDVAVLQDLLREQLMIDQELKFEVEAHERLAGSDFGLKNSGSDEQEDAMIKEIDELKHSLHQKGNASSLDENQIKILLQYVEQILKVLSSLNEWLTRRDEECSRQQPIGGDLQTLKSQRKELQIIQVDLEEKRILLEKAVETAYLALREEGISKTFYELGSKHLDNNAFYSMIASIEELAHVVPRKWVDIRQKVVDYYIAVCSTSKSLNVLQKLLDDLEKALQELKTQNFWLPVEKLSSDSLQNEIKRAKIYHQSIRNVKYLVDDCNAMANQLQDTGLVLSHKYVGRLEEYNRIWKEMNTVAEQRVKSLSDVIKMKDQNVQIFLSIAIQPPWEKAMTLNNVPYYINHETEATYWNHPEMTNLMHDLNGLNAVRFSAYRTAMKLRMLQLKLKLSSVSLERVSEFFKTSMNQQFDATISASDVMAWLLELFGASHSRLNATLDLILNWLFNVFDTSRSGHFKVLSIKVSIILLCNSSLENKFKKLFELVANNRGSVQPQQLASLLLECLKIPRQLGEVQAFGGLNVEPSVKSCFEKVLCDQEIRCAQFLEWTKMEPQSLVWLHVFHRLVAAERSVHQAKCFICKISPITGFRYHCLKCFNFDLCQNCFFSGCSAKSHKLSHPMQEYYIEASSSEEMRDLKKMLKNKFRSKRYFKKHPRLGYLPVQTTDELLFERSQSSSPKHFHPSSTNDVTFAQQQQQRMKTSFTSNPSVNSDEHHLIAQYCQNLHGIEEVFNEGVENRQRKRSGVDLMGQDSEHDSRLLQQDCSQIKLVRSEPSLLCRELSVDTGKEIYTQEDYLKRHRSRLEARIQYLEGQNKHIETTLGQLKNFEYEPEQEMRVLTYSSSFVPPNGHPSSEPITSHPPPSFCSVNKKSHI